MNTTSQIEVTRVIRCLCVALLLVWTGELISAEPPPDEEKQPFVALPEPLDEISGNLLDLENSGYFTITKAEYTRRIGDQDLAMIWTMKVNKTLTSRHALMLLRHFRDVRFYDTDHGARIELHSTLMYLADQLHAGAIDRKLLSEDDEFRIWVYVSAVDIRKLMSQGADTVFLSAKKWR